MHVTDVFDAVAVELQLGDEGVQVIGDCHCQETRCCHLDHDRDCHTLRMTDSCVPPASPSF